MPSAFRAMCTKSSSIFLSLLCLQKTGSFRSSGEGRWDGEGRRSKSRWGSELNRRSPDSLKPGLWGHLEWGKDISAPPLRCISVLSLHRETEQTYMRYTQLYTFSVRIITQIPLFTSPGLEVAFICYLSLSKFFPHVLPLRTACQVCLCSSTRICFINREVYR